MGVARYQFHNVPPIWPILQKFVLRLSEHGDVIETQAIRFVHPKAFLANSVPERSPDCVDTLKALWLRPVFAESYRLFRVNQAKERVAVRI